MGSPASLITQIEDVKNDLVVAAGKAGVVKDLSLVVLFNGADGVFGLLLAFGCREAEAALRQVEQFWAAAINYHTNRPEITASLIHLLPKRHIPSKHTHPLHPLPTILLRRPPTIINMLRTGPHLIRNHPRIPTNHTVILIRLRQAADLHTADLEQAGDASARLGESAVVPSGGDAFGGGVGEAWWEEEGEGYYGGEEVDCFHF